MTGKQALESLVEIYDINKTTKQYKTIKQDLERNEELEKENQELKNIADSFRKGNQGYCKKVIELEKENKELKMQKNSTMLLMKLMSLDDNIVESALILDEYRNANEILKSVIILPMENDISMVDSEGNKYYILRFIKRLLNEKEYNLLKEVLK